MSDQLTIVRHEDPASELAPSSIPRWELTADKTTKVEREALDWLVSQLKFQRTLEVLRNQGPAPDQQHPMNLAA